jgi:hypothetical protein
VVPVSVAKFTRPDGCTQAVRKPIRTLAIGAQIVRGDRVVYLIHCSKRKNNFGTDAAVKNMRIHTPRLLT